MGKYVQQEATRQDGNLSKLGEEERQKEIDGDEYAYMKRRGEKERGGRKNWSEMKCG